MGSKKQQKKEQDKQSLGHQPEAGDELDERQREGSLDNSRSAQADDGSGKDAERSQRARVSPDDNNAGQNRMNES